MINDWVDSNNTIPVLVSTPTGHFHCRAADMYMHMKGSPIFLLDVNLICQFLKGRCKHIPTSPVFCFLTLYMDVMNFSREVCIRAIYQYTVCACTCMYTIVCTASFLSLIQRFIYFFTRKWDLSTLKCTKIFNGHQDTVVALSYCKKTQQFASASLDKSCKGRASTCEEITFNQRPSHKLNSH